MVKVSTKIKVQPIFAWYDAWIGIFWDRNSRRLYILPIPCIGIMIEFKRIYVRCSDAGT